jgi:hypothetical protein
MFGQFFQNSHSNSCSIGARSDKVIFICHIKFLFVEISFGAKHSFHSPIKQCKIATFIVTVGFENNTVKPFLLKMGL